MNAVKIIECPRDAMQGIRTFIPTDAKVTYIQSLLRVGFDTIDVGIFVSPKAIPQMQDTAEVLDRLDLSQTSSKLLAIIANVQGAHAAAARPEIRYLGYPFSISENFHLNGYDIIGLRDSNDGSSSSYASQHKVKKRKEKKKNRGKKKKFVYFW